MYLFLYNSCNNNPEVEDPPAHELVADVAMVGGSSWIALPPASTSAVPPVTGNAQGETLYLVDNEEGDYLKKKRQLELQVLEAQVAAYYAHAHAMNEIKLCAESIRKKYEQM